MEPPQLQTSLPIKPEKKKSATIVDNTTNINNNTISSISNTIQSSNIEKKRKPNEVIEINNMTDEVDKVKPIKSTTAKRNKKQEQEAINDENIYSSQLKNMLNNTTNTNNSHTKSSSSSNGPFSATPVVVATPKINFNRLSTPNSMMSFEKSVEGGRRSSLRSYTSPSSPQQAVPVSAVSVREQQNQNLEFNALKLKITHGRHEGEVYTLNSFDLHNNNSCTNKVTSSISNKKSSSTTTTRKTTTTSKKDSSYQQRIIGRHMNADISLIHDDCISETHAYILWSKCTDGNIDLNIKDKNSTNGTKVNGIRLKRYLINSLSSC